MTSYRVTFQNYIRARCFSEIMVMLRKRRCFSFKTGLDKNKQTNKQAKSKEVMTFALLIRSTTRFTCSSKKQINMFPIQSFVCTDFILSSEYMIIPLSSIKPQELLLSCSLDKSDAGFALPLRHRF